MKLNKLKRVEREVKAICYIDEKNNVMTAYDRFEELKEKYEDSIIVYQPDSNQQKTIYELLSENAKVEGDRFNSELSVENSYTLLKELTDVELSTLEDDREVIQDIIENPSLLLLQVNDELNAICNHLFRKMYNYLLELDKYPNEIKENVFLSEENKVIELENAVAERELQELREQKEKELKELEEQLKAKKKKTTRTPKKK